MISAASTLSSARLRILDITKFYSASSGGVKTYMDAKIGDFAQRDLTHTLVVPGSQPTVSYQGRTRVYRLAGPVIPFSPSYRLMLSASAIDQVLLRERPQVVEVGSPFVVPWLINRARGRHRFKTVGFYHSDLVRTYAEPMVSHRWAAPLRVAAKSAARAYVAEVYDRFDVTVAASPSVAAELRSFGIRNVISITLGVDLDVFRPPAHQPAALRRQVGARPGQPIGIYMGRFCSEKRIDVVLAAHEKLPAELRPFLVLAGTGQLQSKLETHARKHTDIAVLPYQSDRAHVADLLRGADFYLACGPGETFGLAIAEALACGLPLLVVDRGAAPDRIKGTDCGELYAHGSADSCAEAMTRLVARLGPSLHQAARTQACKNFDWKLTFDQLARLYQDLAST